MRALVSQPRPGTHLARQIAGAEIGRRNRRSPRWVLTLVLLEVVLPRFVLIPLPLNRALLIASRPDQFLLRVFDFVFIQRLFRIQQILLLLERLLFAGLA